jgi:hypothetical protein
MMRDYNICNRSGEHVARIGFNDALGLSQIVVLQREAMEFFCPTKEIAFAAWRDQFSPETGFPRPAAVGLRDA